MKKYFIYFWYKTIKPENIPYGGTFTVIRKFRWTRLINLVYFILIILAIYLSIRK